MNTKFCYNLSDAWCAALSHGHSAFRLLQIASEIESEYDDLKARLPTLEHGHLKYLHAIGRCHFLTNDMLKIASASVAAFQAMMEGLINNAIASQPKLAVVKAGLTNKSGKWESAPFARKWIQSLTKLCQPTSEFESYDIGIYRRFRIPLIHPHNANLADIDSLEFAVIRDGYRDGWLAGSRLYDGLGMSYDRNGWQTMCQSYQIAE